MNAGAQRAVETHDLVKVFGTGPTEVRALDGVDFVVEDGEFVAVMGPSDRARARCSTYSARSTRRPREPWPSAADAMTGSMSAT